MQPARREREGLKLTRRVLTQKQLAVLAFIQSYFDEHRRYPLIREVQAGCRIISYKSALDRLNALDRKGYIKRLPNKHRGIRLLRKSQPQNTKTPNRQMAAA